MQRESIPAVNGSKISSGHCVAAHRSTASTSYRGIRVLVYTWPAPLTLHWGIVENFKTH